MQEALQLVVGGLASGAIYALVAVGFTLLWRAARTLNFAQGQFAVVPGYFALLAINLGLPAWMAILVALAVAMLLFGALFKLVLVNPVARHGLVPLTIATLALGFALDHALGAVFDAEMRPRLTLTRDGPIEFAGMALPMEDLAILLVAAIAVLTFLTFLDDTRVGRAIQAVMHDATVANVLGIRTRQMALHAFMLNAVLAGIAAILIGLPGPTRPIGATALTVAAMAASILGGFGLRATIAAALLLGVVEQVAATFVAPAYRDAILPLLLIAAVALRARELPGLARERMA